MSKQIERGVAKLNKHYPGWYNDVNPYWLDMSSCRDCVLGQLYGQYIRGFWKIRMLPLTGGMYGFNHRLITGVFDRIMLSRDWSRTILALREAECAAKRAPTQADYELVI